MAAKEGINVFFFFWGGGGGVGVGGGWGGLGVLYVQQDAGPSVRPDPDVVSCSHFILKVFPGVLGKGFVEGLSNYGHCLLCTGCSHSLGILFLSSFSIQIHTLFKCMCPCNKGCFDAMIQSKPRELPFTEQIFSILVNHSFNQHYIAMGIIFFLGGGGGCCEVLLIAFFLFAFEVTSFCISIMI